MKENKDISKEALQAPETLEDLEIREKIPLLRIAPKIVPEDTLGNIAIFIIGILGALAFIARIFGFI